MSFSSGVGRWVGGSAQLTSKDKTAGGGKGEDEGSEGRKRHGLGVPVVSKKVVRPCRGDRFSLVLAGQRSKSTSFLCNRVEGLAQVLAPI